MTLLEAGMWFGGMLLVVILLFIGMAITEYLEARSKYYQELTKNLELQRKERKMTFTYNHQPVTKCGDCPRNIAYDNPLWKMLPQTHYCLDTFVVTEPKGRLILNPNIIPIWCIHDTR